MIVARRSMRIAWATLIVLLTGIMPVLADPPRPNTMPRAPAVPKPADASAQTLLLQVQVNGYALDLIGEFTLRDGALLARRHELQDLGFRVPASLPDGPDALIALAALPGLTARLDQASQTLFVTADNRLLTPTLLRAGAGPGAGGVTESGTGATFDYDINGTSAGGQNLGSGIFDLRAFSSRGTASTGVLTYLGGSSGNSSRSGAEAIRLDSTYSYSDPDTLLHYRLGDFISGGLSWTRPIRLGGAQVSLDFGIRPDLVTFPLPSVSGSVAVPSTVDVLVNGTRLFSQQVRAGPFLVPQLPVVTGGGTISTTLTNALGRQVVTTLPFYASSLLLAPGLQNFSLQAGAIRRNWGLISDDYASLAGSATYRRGLTSWLTVEGSAEASTNVTMAGGGVAVNLANFAVLNAAFAGSTGVGNGAGTGAGGMGTQFSLGLQRQGQRFSVGASATMANRFYRDLAAVNGDPTPRLQLNGNAGLSLGRYGSVGLAYESVDRDALPSPIRLHVPPGTVLDQGTFQLGSIFYLQPAQHAHVLSASYSTQIGNVGLYATGFRDFASGGSSGVLFGLTVPLGARSSAGVSLGDGAGGRYGQVQASQSAVTVGDTGFQVFGSTGNTTHEFGELQYKSPWALLSAGADRIDRQTSLRLEAQGSASFLDKRLFLSNTINDSFAVVNTNGLKNVRVLDENREVGRTDSSGQLLLPDLRSFEANHISIDPTDIPADTAVAVTSKEVRPQDRSGVVVRFGVQVSHAALLHLVDDAGKPLPVGSIATLRATGVTVPVGYDGAAYVEGLAPHNDLAVQWPDGRRCAVAFDYRPVPGQIPSIGPLRCPTPTP